MTLYLKTLTLPFLHYLALILDNYMFSTVMVLCQLIWVLGPYFLFLLIYGHYLWIYPSHLPMNMAENIHHSFPVCNRLSSHISCFFCFITVLSGPQAENLGHIIGSSFPHPLPHLRMFVDWPLPLIPTRPGWLRRSLFYWLLFSPREWRSDCFHQKPPLSSSFLL